MPRLIDFPCFALQHLLVISMHLALFIIIYLNDMLHLQVEHCNVPRVNINQNVLNASVPLVSGSLSNKLNKSFSFKTRGHAYLMVRHDSSNCNIMVAYARLLKVIAPCQRRRRTDAKHLYFNWCLRFRN